MVVGDDGGGGVAVLESEGSLLDLCTWLSAAYPRSARTFYTSYEHF